MYNPVKKADFWTGRTDDEDGDAGLRWHQKVECLDLNVSDPDLTSDDICLLGYKTNQGVARNKGRVGAKNGPVEIRKAMASFAWHFSDNTRLIDAGNVSDSGTNLEKVQYELADFTAAIHRKKSRLIVLGGGHDIAYGHYIGLREAYPQQKIGIINFDAHFDLRKPVQGESSGTPFYRIFKDCQKSGHDFNYLCLGVLPQANTRALYDTANETGTRTVEVDKVHLLYLDALKETLGLFIEETDVIYLTVCLDVFSAAYAPGVSAVNPAGISPDIVFALIAYLKTLNKAISFDIAEMNPEYDVDSRTAKLAAALVYEFLK